MQALAQRLTDLQRAVNAEAAQRDAIKNSPDAQRLASELTRLTAEYDALFDGLDDSMTALQQAKAEMMMALRDQGMSAYENVTAKFKEKREVNRQQLLTAIDGDLDLYFTLSHVTQVALKDFAKNRPDKKELLGCIEVVEREMVDVEVNVAAMPDGRDDLPERPDAPDHADTLAHEAGQ